MKGLFDPQRGCDTLVRNAASVSCVECAGTILEGGRNFSKWDLAG